MKQFGRLFYFEWKKIWMRRGTWIALLILLVCHVVIEGLYFTGSTYVEGEFLETHMEGAKTDAENGRKLSGRKIDSQLLREMQAAYLKYEDKEYPKCILSDDYQKTVRPYSTLYRTIRLSLWSADGVSVDLLKMTEKQYYEARKAAVSKQWKDAGLTGTERAYWQKKEEQLKKPFTYQYAQGYDYLISMSGIYRVCMLVTFLIAICMSALFTEEHNRKTDQLILCSKLGRKQVYAAKTLSGSLFAIVVTTLLFLVSLVFAFVIYGTDGFSAAIQLHTGAYSGTVTVGQTMLIMAGILLLSSVLLSIFTMVLSEVLGSNLAGMSAAIVVMFLARLVSIPNQYRIFSQAWNYIPINLLKFDQGFCDTRLVRIFGLNFTSWEFSVILYVAFMILFVYIGKKVYCGYQIKGR